MLNTIDTKKGSRFCAIRPSTLFNFGHLVILCTGICTLHRQRRWTRTCDRYASTSHAAHTCLSHWRVPAIA